MDTTNAQHNINSAIEAIGSNPKVAALVATSTAAAGVASKVDIIQGWLSVVSMGVGIFTGLIIASIQMIRLERAWRERRQESKEGA